MEQYDHHPDAQQHRSAPVSPDAKEERHRSGKDDRAASHEADANEEVPSTEQEIEPGVNQDSSSGESFSSEPGHEAAGTEQGN